MKLKAVVYEDAPKGLIERLNGIRYTVFIEVLQPILHVPKDFGPADFYVQQCDFCTRDTHQPSNEHMCVVGLSNVSGPTIARSRSINAYYEARARLQDIYTDIWEAFLPRGERCQLYVSIALDSPISDPNGRATTLAEGPTEWV